MPYTFADQFDHIDSVSHTADLIEAALNIETTQDAMDLLVSSDEFHAFIEQQGIDAEDAEGFIVAATNFVDTVSRAVTNATDTAVFNPLVGALYRIEADPRAFARSVANAIGNYGVVISLVPRELGEYTHEMQRVASNWDVVTSGATFAMAAATAMGALTAAGTLVVGTAAVAAAGSLILPVGGIILACTIAATLIAAARKNRRCRQEAINESRDAVQILEGAVDQWFPGASRQLKTTVVGRIASTIPMIAGTFDDYDGCDSGFEQCYYYSLDEPPMGWIGDKRGPKRGAGYLCDENCDRQSYMEIHAKVCEEFVNRINEMPDLRSKKRALIGVIGYFRGVEGFITEDIESLFTGLEPTAEELSDLLNVAGVQTTAQGVGTRGAPRSGGSGGLLLIGAAAAALGYMAVMK